MGKGDCSLWRLTWYDILSIDTYFISLLGLVEISSGRRYGSPSTGGIFTLDDGQRTGVNGGYPSNKGFLSYRVVLYV